MPEAAEGAKIPGRWVDAGDLQVGDVLLLKSGEQAPVTRLAVRQVQQRVYNFQVEELHCYAVGAGEVLVHNNCGDEINFGQAGRTIPDEINFPNGRAPEPPRLSEISTGRTQPINLKEQLTMLEAKAGAGNQIIPANKIGDPRFAGGDWAKFESNHLAPDKTNYTVHIT